MDVRDRVKTILSCDRDEYWVLHMGMMKTRKVCTSNKLKDRLTPFYYGYKRYLNVILPQVQISKAASIAVTDDFGLQLITALRELGYRNFTLIITDWDVELAKRFAVCISRAWKNDLTGVDVKLLEECKGMKFDLIISNPPYEVGNDITRRILDTVDYDQFLNLMPLSKYKKGSLYRHIEKKLGAVNLWDKNTFSSDDAKTSPDLCLLSKLASNIKSYEEFERTFYYDSRLAKFWQLNTSRERTYLEHICICAPNRFSQIDSRTSFTCGIYTPHDKVHQIASFQLRFKSETSAYEYLRSGERSARGNGSEEYIWNFIKPDCSINQCFIPNKAGTISQILTIFKTEQEKDNFVKWWYSAELEGRSPKSGLASILLAGLNKPTDCPFDAAIPNVDWTREWTDEEILRDYGYTDSEVEEILSLGKNNLYGRSLWDYKGSAE